MGKRRIIESDESDDMEPRSDAMSDADSDLYHVEVITKIRVNDLGLLEYYVKWWNYGPDEDTWEPHENVKDCTRLLNSLWMEIGIDKRKNPGPPGSIYFASNEWIKKERAYFKSAMEADRHGREGDKRRMTQNEGDISRPESSKAITEKDATVKPKPKRNSVFLSTTDDDSDSEPLMQKIAMSKPQQPTKTKEKEKNVLKAPQYQTTHPPRQSTPQSGMPSPQIPSPQAPNFQASNPRLSSPQVPNPQVPNPQVSNPQVSNPQVLQTRLPKNLSKISSTSNLFVQKSHPVAPVTPATPSAQVTSDDVDNLLATIGSHAEAKTQNPIHTASSKPDKATSLLGLKFKFEKIWRWAGDLSLDTSKTDDRLCRIAITDTIDISGGGHKLQAVLESRDSIRLSKTFDRFEIDTVLRSLKGVDQFARMSHQTEQDREMFNILIKFLEKDDKVIDSPVITDSGHVAEMIIFPSTSTRLRTLLKVPSHYRDNSSLTIALMPCILPPANYKEKYVKVDKKGYSSRDATINAILNFQPTSSIRLLEFKVSLEILQFPSKFIDFLRKRPCCIWSYPVDPMPQHYGKEFLKPMRQETECLLNVINFVKAENVGYRADVRVIFVHVGALRTINQLHALVERRWRRAEIRFITYGRHEDVKPSLWGFREIFPLGGIITFTFNSLLENPIYVAELIEQIHQHPLWQCYISPSVLSVFIKMTCPDEAPALVYSREPDLFGNIFKLIDEGKLALMRCSNLPGKPMPNPDSCEWIIDQLSVISKTPTDIIEEGWMAYISNFSSLTEAEIQKHIEDEIVNDLISLQMQPAICENFRRFVVIKAVSEVYIDFDKNGFEWQTIQEFDFKDNFYIEHVNGRTRH